MFYQFLVTSVVEPHKELFDKPKPSSLASGLTKKLRTYQKVKDLPKRLRTYQKVKDLPKSSGLTYSTKPTPRLAHVIFYLCLPCDLFSIMDETEVVRIVESTVSKKNENLLASMKSFLDDSILKRAETFACGHRKFPPQRNQEA